MVQSIDDLLAGGFETQSLVEVYGEFGSGKTQIGHQLAVNCTLPIEQGGLDGDVFYIDTEDTFRPERITQMAKDENIWALGHPKDIGGGGMPFMDYVYINEVIGKSI